MSIHATAHGYEVRDEHGVVVWSGESYLDALAFIGRQGPE
jgi:hypothetical protein